MATYKDFKGITNSSGDIFTNPQIEEALYVNGVLTEPDSDGTITLTSQSSYTLSGRHYGRIIIGASTETDLTDDTHIILDGVEIIANDSNAYGIYYASKSQSLFVTLARNKRNTILCQYVQAMGEQQGACLYSENNMVLQGCGYLAVENRGGHGIKASELRISGNPHIYASAVHDAIHGNSALNIDGGFFYVAQANDAFGTGDSGNIKVFGGTFRCYGVSQNAFDSKVAGLYYGTLDLRTNASTPTSGMSAYSKPSAGTVTADGTEVDATNGVYTCAGADIQIGGYIEGTINITDAKAEVTLNGAYIKGTLAYTANSSNMQVNANNATINVIEGNITSANNLKIEVKGGGHLIVEATTGNAIEGSEVTIHDSKGVLIAHTADSSAYGIQGTDIYLADSADHKALADEGVYGAIQVDSIYARLTSKGKKANLTIANANLLGVVVVDKIVQATGSTSTTGVDLGASPRVFYHELTGDTLVSDCGRTYESHDVVTCGVGAMAL